MGGMLQLVVTEMLSSSLTNTFFGGILVMIYAVIVLVASFCTQPSVYVIGIFFIAGDIQVCSDSLGKTMCTTPCIFEIDWMKN